MTPVTFEVVQGGGRLGLKGPRAADWLGARGINLPAKSNSWVEAGQPPLLVARLGSSEFFLEEAGGADTVRRLAAALDARPAGVYPVLREDCAFVLTGIDGRAGASGNAGVHDVLAQICNVDFAALETAAQAVVMTLMVGVAVLVVPQEADGMRRYRVWCDPTFGHYLAQSVETVVSEMFRGVSA